MRVDVGRGGGVGVGEGEEEGVAKRAWWGVSEGRPAQGRCEGELAGFSEEGGVHGTGVEGEEGLIRWVGGVSSGACEGGEGARPLGEEGEEGMAACGVVRDVRGGRGGVSLGGWGPV